MLSKAGRIFRVMPCVTWPHHVPTFMTGLLFAVSMELLSS